MKNGRRVLIVEDEALIAFLLEEMIQDLGYEVAGTANSLAAAMETEPGSFDCAILDMNLNGVPVHPFAATLSERGIPFAYVTGGGPVPEAHRDAILLQKPFRPESLKRALDAMAG